MSQLSIDDPPVCALDTLAACTQAAMAWADIQPAPQALRSRVARTGERFLDAVSKRGAWIPAKAAVATFEPYQELSGGIRWTHVTRDQFEAALTALALHLLAKMDQK